MRTGKIILLALVVFMAVSGTALAASNVNYSLPSMVLSSAGGEKGSPSYRVIDTVGESSIGISTSTSYKLQAGFLGFLAAGGGRLEGDVNNDGKINSVDALKIAQHLVGIITLTGDDFLAADVDDSGGVNSVDLLMVKQYLVGIRNSFPGGPYVP